MYNGMHLIRTLFCMQSRDTLDNLDLNIIISYHFYFIWANSFLSSILLQHSRTISDKRNIDLQVIIGAGRGCVYPSKCLTLE